MKTFILFISLIFLPIAAFAKGYGVEIRVASPKMLEIEPGRILTASFLVSNNTANEEVFFENINLPDGWRIITSTQFPFALKSSEQIVRLIAFMVPAASPSGSYEITYTVTSQRDYAIADRDFFQVVVLPVVKLEILLEDKPETVVAGETYHLRLRIFNRGNSATEIKLGIKQNPEYKMEIEPKSMTIETGESQNMRIRVTTDEKLNQKITHVIQIKAEAKEIKNGIVSVHKTVSVEIIPRVTGDLDTFHRIPAQMSFLGTSENGNGGLEFSGYGSLDEEGKRRIEFFMRTPDIQDSGIYGKRDEFRFSYFGETLDIHLGDRAYFLSRLTQNYKYGRGAEIDFRPGNLETGAFFLNSRWSEPEEKEFGGYLKYRFEKVDVKLNLLNKQKSSTHDSQGYEDKIWSLETDFRPNAYTNMELEYASCDRNEGTDDNAYRMNLYGQVFDNVSYYFENVHAGAKYFGYYNDADYRSAFLTFPIYKKLRGSFSYRSYQNNLDKDPSKNTATNESSYNVRANYSLPSGLNISLGYREFNRMDELLPKDYDYKEKTLKLALGKNFSRKLNLYAYMERGQFENNLAQTKNDELERYGLFAYFVPTNNQSYSLYTMFGHDSFIENPERTRNFGVSGNWRIKKNIYCDLNYQKNYFDYEEQNNADRLSFNLTYLLPAGKFLKLSSHWMNLPEGKTDTGFFLTYTVPWNIPVSRKKSVGILKGKVHDIENGGKQPISNVVLKVNGATAVTDRNGEFFFSLKPGDYLLSLERKSIGLERVATVKMPLKVNISGGETKEIEIGVMSSCSISGRIALFISDNSNNGNNSNASEASNNFVLAGNTENGNGNGKNHIKKGDGLSNILIELTDGTEILREVTNSNGVFSFKDIRPGRWTLKVDDNNLPPHHHIEQKELCFELKPKEEKKIIIKVFPQLRPVQIIETGEIK